MTSDSESLRAISCVLISSDTIGSMNTQNDWRECYIIAVRGERAKKQGIGSRLLFHHPNNYSQSIRDGWFVISFTHVPAKNAKPFKPY